jgi:hypothetical protein
MEATNDPQNRHTSPLTERGLFCQGLKAAALGYHVAHNVGPGHSVHHLITFCWYSVSE